MQVFAGHEGPVESGIFTADGQCIAFNVMAHLLTFFVYREAYHHSRWLGYSHFVGPP